jgi:hypothetical protein
MRRLLALGALLAAPLLLCWEPRSAPAQPVSVRSCPGDMLRVRDYCIDRFEISTVDHRTGRALSPFYPPHPRLLEAVLAAWTVERKRVGMAAARELPLPLLPAFQASQREYAPRAVSRPGVVPQGYLSGWLAKQACENAGKRLCTEDEWVLACRGAQGRKFPYGERFEDGRCNVYRHLHPAQLLHGASFYGHLDPRLNLVMESNRDPLLRLTGATAGCRSNWGDDAAYDMVGNLDEWIEDPSGAFVGGFYARSTREGCEARVGVHPTSYYDYSTGARCCRSL